MRLSYSLQKFGQSIFFKVIFDLKMVKEVKGMCETFFFCVNSSYSTQYFTQSHKYQTSFCHENPLRKKRQLEIYTWRPAGESEAPQEVRVAANASIISELHGIFHWQSKVLENFLSEKDVVRLFSTGFGRSLIYEQASLVGELSYC